MEVVGALIAVVMASALMLTVLRFSELRCIRSALPWLIALRFAGALVRYAIIVGYYGGFGDALRYHEVGLQLRENLVAGDLSLWTIDGWNGTRGIEWANAIVGIPALGSVIGEFILFSAVGFVGLAWCVVALRRSAPSLPGRPMAIIVLTWPSLVFWPSSIGKEAVMILTIGMMCLALTAPARRWGLVAAALGLAFAIRPHVAGLEAIGLFIYDTFGKQRHRGVVAARLIVSTVIAGVLIVQGSTQLGIDPTELESVTAEIQYRSNNTDRGGSSLGTRTVGIAALPIGLFNVLFRPLPFEANGPTMLVAAGEVVLLWALMWHYRRAVRRVFAVWRKLPFLMYGAGFGTLWAALIGVTFVNMGILARQRTLMMPFLVGVLALAIALHARDRSKAHRERRGRPRRPSLARGPVTGHGPAAASVDVVARQGI